MGVGVFEPGRVGWGCRTPPEHVDSKSGVAFAFSSMVWGLRAPKSYLFYFSG